MIDGPAEGRTLMCRRAPLFLRVVRSAAGEWDALDQLTDTPRPGETITVYQKVPGSGGAVHLCIRGKNRGAGGFHQLGDYRVVADQPGDETMRFRDRWRAWCEEQVEKIMASVEEAKPDDPA